MKQPEIAAHSSARSGGESRVLDAPGIGVLHMIAKATVGLDEELAAPASLETEEMLMSDGMSGCAFSVGLASMTSPAPAGIVTT